MTLPPSDTPLYNHPLPEIEQWLTNLGCQQDKENLHCWVIARATWSAEVCLDIEEITVRYIEAGDGGEDIKRSFKYSLSRQDVEAAVFSGP
ncbi:MAG: DUF3143 domain-containing protein [Prochloraceae cyanobacterium]|nr:DUF3143 domain-containing protein [Prochloraceae cyanobacterium]